MPYLTEMLQDGTGILHVGEGVLTGAEIIAEISRVTAKLPHPERITHGLIDLTNVTEVRVSVDEIKKITGMDLKISKVMKGIFVAIVAPADLAYGISNMYSGNMWSSNWIIEVFRSREQAVAWLDARLSGESESAV